MSSVEDSNLSFTTLCFRYSETELSMEFAFTSGSTVTFLS